MKPTKLTLCGWGPYRDKQVIDFTELSARGLFLITGATGAGKTSVFDAVMYALYGCMSGETREKNSVRSDFANGDTPTFVELIMMHGGNQYCIYRNPEYFRSSKRKTANGGMTKEKENAILTYPDGKAVQGSNEVTRKIQELLRLDMRQFKQLSMIAQGEFSKFLSAGSSEKTKIFREIFGTEVYDRLAGTLRTRAGELYREIMEYRHKMDETADMYMPDENFLGKWSSLNDGKNYYYEGIANLLSEIQTEYRNVEKELQNKCKEADMEADHASGELKAAEQIQGLFEKLKKERQQQEKLSLVKEVQEEKQFYLKRAEQAFAVQQFETALRNATARKEGLIKKEAELKSETEILQKQKAEIKAIYDIREKLTGFYADMAIQMNISDEAKRIDRLIGEQQDKSDNLKQKYLQEETKEESLKAVFERADKSFRHGIAGILASELAHGQPCPVCGSVVHPAPAAMEAEVPSQIEVENYKIKYESQREIRVALEGQMLSCRTMAESLLEQKKEQEFRWREIQDKLAGRDAFANNYMANHTEAQFVGHIKKQEALSVALTEQEKVLHTLREELETAVQNENTAREYFQNKREEAGFNTEEEYTESLAGISNIEELRKITAEYRESLHINNEMLRHLSEETKGKKQPDCEELKQLFNTRKEVRSRLHEQQTRLLHKISETDKTLSSIRTKLEQLVRLEEKYSIVKDLDDAASGNNKKRLVFEQYVLAAYFEEILRAANLRLKTMTVGRYELNRADRIIDGRSKDNLEIEVLDYYTGRSRSVKTLSGGESFKVSLALALGMSDVVQAGSGGIRVETLFIDEGFGSLDSESLEQACLTLHSLVEKDRLIGIISHVPELSEKIENQIRINKTNAGSNVQVMVF